MSKREREEDPNDQRAEKDAQSKQKASKKSLGDALAAETGGSAKDWVDRLKNAAAAPVTAKTADTKAQKKKEAKPAKPMRVLHDLDDFGVGESVVLTLADRNVLDSDDEEKFESSALKDKERQKARDKKKPAGYDVYDHDAPLLAQYDDEERKTFVLGEDGTAVVETGSKKNKKADDEGAAQRLAEAKAKAAAEAAKLLQGFQEPPRVASDYMTKEEAAALMGGGKKKKKKSKKEKKLREKKGTSELLEDLQQEAGDDDDNDGEDVDRASRHGTRERRQEKTEEGRKQELMEKELRYKKALQSAMKLTKAKLVDTKAVLEDDEEKKLSNILAAPKPAVKKEAMSVEEKLAQRAKERREKKEAEGATTGSAGLVFSSTSEFLKSVKVEDDEDDGESKRAKQVKREHMMDYEDAAVVSAAELQQLSAPPKKEKTGEEEEGEVEDEAAEVGVAPVEPIVAKGLAATLSLLRVHGADSRPDDVVARMHDKSVSKTHKVYVDEDDAETKKKLEGHNFNLDLQKYDRFGRAISQKEEFQQMTKAFHGSESGVKKDEMKMRKYLKSLEMKKKTTTEATLKEVDKMERKQKEQGQAGIKLTVDTAELEQMQEAAKALVKKKMAQKIQKQGK